jgi:hypothetical protein
MAERLAPNRLRLLSDGGSPPNRSTHDSAYFNPDSRLRMLSARRLAKPGARTKSWSSMTALLTGLWQGARQFESNEVQVVTQPNQGGRGRPCSIGR